MYGAGNSFEGCGNIFRLKPDSDVLRISRLKIGCKFVLRQMSFNTVRTEQLIAVANFTVQKARGTVQTDICLVLYKYVKHAVAQLVEALRYKSEGRGFDSRWCHWNFSLT